MFQFYKVWGRDRHFWTVRVTLYRKRRVIGSYLLGTLFWDGWCVENQALAHFDDCDFDDADVEVLNHNRLECES